MHTIELMFRGVTILRFTAKCREKILYVDIFKSPKIGFKRSFFLLFVYSIIFSLFQRVEGLWCLSAVSVYLLIPVKIKNLILFPVFVDK